MAIVNAYAGAMPWRKQKQKLDKGAGYQWNAGIAQKMIKGMSSPVDYATGGWTVVSPAGGSGKTNKPEMVEIHLYNGRKSYVPIGDVNTFVGFRKIPDDRVDAEMSAEIEKAWATDTGRGKYYSCEGVGHITKIRYNPTMQIMEVSFKTDGAVVTFFRVPKELYLEFEHHATSGSMSMGVDGTQRHLLGIRFWDLVRIRGQRTGSKYPFTYSSGGVTDGAQAQGSYAEFQDRAYGVSQQQAVDAQREATITNREEAPPEEKKQIEREQTEADLKADTRLTERQRQIIMDMQDAVEKRYGFQHPVYRKFAELKMRHDMGGLLVFKTTYLK